jgi:cytochrome d ubiquinol oxidase subunit I
VDAVDVARLQFAMTTVYHFLFVPLSIGLSMLLALLQTAWYRTGKAKYEWMTKFWSKLFLINFAIGVVTGIVLEFQFGMNWSDYSRFVGDVFGGPLAMEAILAFFLESTFIGLWIFGWGRLPPGAHLACIWVVAIGSSLSAFFILAANSWMQHPVGFRIDPGTGRAQLTNFWAMLTNSTALVAFPHVITASFVTAAALVIGVSAWHLARGQHVDLMRTSLTLGIWMALLAGGGTALSGDAQAKIMTEQQPMKMAAAEAIYRTRAPASFSIFTIGTPDGHTELFSVRVPHLLSFLAKGDLNAEVEGIDNIQAEYEQRYGPGDYRPYVPVTYWSFRYMIALGLSTVGLALVTLWFTRTRSIRRPRRLYRVLVWAIPLPMLGNTFGWIFTEMGRQPWVVFGHLQTRDAVSPSVPTWQVATSLVGFAALYLALGVVWVRLIARYAKAGPPVPEPEPAGVEASPVAAEKPLTFAY